VRTQPVSKAAALLAACLALAPVRAQVTTEAAEVTSLKQLSLDELMNLEVTSVSKRPEKLFEAASAIEVITQEDIRRSGASHIAEVLRLAPNLAVAQKGSHSWGISARGFNTDLANKLLVLMDGRAVYTPLYSGVFWERQDYLLADLDRVEVVSGPGGTLWGANAVNGVINIISKSARDTQGLYAEAGAGNELEVLGGARYGAQLAPNVYLRVYGKYAERDGGTLANGTDAHDAWNFGQGGFRLDALPGSGDVFTLQGDIYDSDLDVLTGGSSKQSGHNLLGRWSRELAGGSTFALQVYYDHTHLDGATPAFVANNIVLAPAGRLTDDLDTYDIDFQHTFRAGERHQLIWGLGYRFTHDEVGNSPALGFLPPVLDQDLFSGFAQDEITLRDDLTFTLGTKVEHNDYTGSEWEPGARLRWNINDRNMLWSAVSRAVRMPSRIDRDVTQGTPPYFVLLAGGKDFVSETVIAYELGYRTQLSDQLSVSLTGFYNRYDDIRSTSLNPTTIFPLYFTNNVEGETHGLEASFVYQAAAWWRLQGGYNLLDEDLRVQAGGSDFNNALNETADPRNQLLLRSSMDLPHDWELDVAWRWVDELTINNAGVPSTVPSYAELDVRLAWHPTPTLELAVIGRNLLHDHHAEYGIAGPTREEVDRSIYGKVTWRF
jgi:iron complex outermembrane receptor protein